ncbi:hypothetical protein [Hespellia stercorisuis]|uniref:Uncharacterized protein n=1 Tax=Hespellia stercorisuis DSM 15480 TaxID=1121950 RepID=A0A1M6M7J8_9FIRM|nr:hypothetical protein [Hespellia stercorisuis]SHJ79426.1 hypothetical protein SAMN02745243_01392 [Hespellia stercorisuis DSM 15480]
MKLKEIWKEYECESVFNLSVLPEDIREKGTVVKFEPKSVIALKGEFPEYNRH